MTRTRFSPQGLPPEWAAFLSEVAAAIPVRVEVHCTGPFAAAARYRAPLHFSEIEYVATVPARGVEILRVASPESDLSKRLGLSLSFSGNAEYVEDYERRLQPVYPGRFGSLRLFAMEAHDLVLASLGSRRAADGEVLESLMLNGFLKRGILERRFQEGLRPYVANPQRLDASLARLLKLFD